MSTTAADTEAVTSAAETLLGVPMVTRRPHDGRLSTPTVPGDWPTARRPGSPTGT